MNTQAKQKKVRYKKVKPDKPPQMDEFVSYASSITGFKGNCIKLKSGFSAMVEVPGIDVVNYKPYDKENAFEAFARALISSEGNFKISFLQKSPDYSTQIQHLQKKLSKTRHPHKRYILEEQIQMFIYYSTNQTDRMAYVFFFNDTPELALKGAENFIDNMRVVTQPHICTKREVIDVLRIMLRGREG